MTIEEYSTRMGYLGFPSDEEYVKANLAYMMAGNMDKDEFCKDYRKHKDSVIIATLADAANSRDIAYRDKQTKERQTAHALLREADEIRQGGMEARRHLGEKLNGGAMRNLQEQGTRMGAGSTPASPTNH